MKAIDIKRLLHIILLISAFSLPTGTFGQTVSLQKVKDIRTDEQCAITHNDNLLECGVITLGTVKMNVEWIDCKYTPQQKAYHITGRLLSDEENESLGGVTIYQAIKIDNDIQLRSLSGVSDLNGKFDLTIGEKYLLVFNYPGYSVEIYDFQMLRP